jgi:predicted nucleic acid-binding protein
MKNVLTIYKATPAEISVSGSASRLKYDYKELGFTDIQHAISAKDCGAQNLIAFDKKFKREFRRV